MSTSAASRHTRAVRGRYFDELRVGKVFDGSPSVTLIGGMSMAHRSMVGNRLRLSLDETLAAEVMWEIRRVSLASRGACLPFRRYPLVGDMLTTVDGLKENIRRQNQLLTGLTAMHIATTDQRERPVLDRTMFA